MNCSVYTGATLSMIPRFEPGKALEILQRDKVTIFQGVPTMYGALLNHPQKGDYDLSSLRLCMSGGAAMPGEVMRAFEEAFGCKVLEGYGLSETSPVASFNHPDKERKVGSIGTPIEGVEMKVVDDEANDLAQGEVGEIAIKGHNIMKGYWRRDDATAEVMRDGWFLTGDMGKIDEDGYFFIVDRKKEMIIRGGYNVYPREIEEVLYEHPAVRECAVVSVPDAKMGEEVGAAVAVREGEDVSEDDLRAFVKEQVANYKYPRQDLVRGRAAEGSHGQDPQEGDRGSRGRADALSATARRRPRVDKRRRHPRRRRPRLRARGLPRMPGLRRRRRGRRRVRARLPLLRVEGGHAGHALHRALAAPPRHDRRDRRGRGLRPREAPPGGVLHHRLLPPRARADEGDHRGGHPCGQLLRARASGQDRPGLRADRRHRRVRPRRRPLQGRHLGPVRGHVLLRGDRAAADRLDLRPHAPRGRRLRAREGPGGRDHLRWPRGHRR
ncbi:MAG: AMP-binding protein [Thermoleophilaceae bacterium]